MPRWIGASDASRTRAAYSNGASDGRRGRPAAARPRSMRAQAAITARRGSGSRSRSSRVSSSSSTSRSARVGGGRRRRRSARSWATTIATMASRATPATTIGTTPGSAGGSTSSRVLGVPRVVAGSSSRSPPPSPSRSRNSHRSTIAAIGRIRFQLPARRPRTGRCRLGQREMTTSTPAAIMARNSSSTRLSTRSAG
ncbi:MAG TPA: hypothetical protein VF468_14285 [Actinomycetota bacterium]|nr:hypothetical protein [Actinomycetota bacterium]